MANPSPKSLRARPRQPLARIPRAITALLVFAATSAQAQQTTLPAVVISGQGSATPDVTGLGDLPWKDLPVSATVIGRRQIESSGARRLADLTQFDSSVSDAYNAPGYWDFLSIRGFTLDNKFNYRREGLPISAETSIPLDNKERVEILKGTSGLQAGVSAPGGLVNYVVKRPTEQDLREVRMEVTSRASVLGAVDLGGRFGADNRFGYRINVAHESLRPLVRDLDGERNLAAFAGDWRISRDSVLEAEVEWSHKSQASQTGFSLLGSVLPAPVDPRLNLNNQSWVKPTVFDATTGTLRFTQALGPDWKWTAQLGTQRLRTNDYTAFPFGCGAEGNYDRFCSDGTFDYYDYRSEGETRQQGAAALNLRGKLVTSGVTHDLSVGLLSSKVRDRLPPEAFNFVGTGNVNGTAIVPEDPTTFPVDLDRDQRTLELSVNDAIHWNQRLTTWLGFRHTKLDRGYTQSLTTPWAAIGYQVSPTVAAYASYGQGVESQQVPNNPAIYANPGDVLPALKSRQWEAGVKGDGEALAWQLAWFDIRRPMSNIDFCDRTFAACVGQYDGSAVHRGLEANAQWTAGALRLGGGATLLHARREGSVLEPADNGQRPPNVPNAILRANAGWKFNAVPGLELRAQMSHEGTRAVLADGSAVLPAWTRMDASLRYEQKVGGANVAWTLGVDNLTDKRYWKESPYQFGHVYLYPGAARTFRLAMTVAL